MYHPKLLQGWWWYMSVGYVLDTTNIPKMKGCLLESGRCLNADRSETYHFSR
jgi:hypothetical protein